VDVGGVGFFGFFPGIKISKQKPMGKRKTGTVGSERVANCKNSVVGSFDYGSGFRLA
jgi:hypothetical protein